MLRRQSLSGRRRRRARRLWTQVLTLDQALQYAVDHYPTVRAALEQVNASTAGVSVAQAAYLPRLDSLWQSNRRTANNIFGQVLPQSVIPAMSGPVLPSASAGSVWGSATGALFSWEPFDFGLRGATVAGAEAAVTRARAGEALTRLDVQSAVGAAFLERHRRPACRDGARRRTWSAATCSRAPCTRSSTISCGPARKRRGPTRSGPRRRRASFRRRQAVTLAQTTMARVLGVTAGGRDASTRATLLDQLPPRTCRRRRAGARIRWRSAHQAAVDVARAQEEVLARTDLPRVYLQSSVFARGSGANPNGELDGGLGDSVSNARTGRLACRSCFPMCSTSRACARARPPRRPRRGPRRRCTTRRS